MNNLEYIGSILASIVIVSITATIILATVGVATLGVVPQAWFVGIIVPLVIMSLIEAFGEEVYKVFTKNR
jgi:hypothetical protein